MSDKRFSIPVAVRLGVAGQRMIFSAWEAPECLKIQWPRKYAPSTVKRSNLVWMLLMAGSQRIKRGERLSMRRVSAGIFLEVDPQH